MKSLELKIPPAAVVLLSSALMWIVSRLLPAGVVALPGGVPIAIALAVAGAVVTSLGVMAFRRVSTTVNPTKPESTAVLVCSGVYRVTRNPMYLGFLLILFGWALFLANIFALLLLPGFLVYMNRFQIAPEERALTARFGQSFVTYTSQVRRWL